MGGCSTKVRPSLVFNAILQELFDVKSELEPKIGITCISPSSSTSSTAGDNLVWIRIREFCSDSTDLQISSWLTEHIRFFASYVKEISHLSDWDCHIVRGAELREVVEELGDPVLHVLLHQLHKGLNLVSFDVLLQQFPNVTKWSRRRTVTGVVWIEINEKQKQTCYCVEVLSLYPQPGCHGQSAFA